MKTIEIITAILGVLGFILATANTIWNFRQHRPRFLLIPRSGQIFDADVRGEPGHFYTDPPRRAKIVDIVVDIANCSARNNSVVSVEWSAGGAILPLDPTARYQVGEKVVDLGRFLGPGRTQRTGEYWEYPQQWVRLLPVELASGMSRQAHCSGEIKSLADLGVPPRIKLSVFDAYGRVYTKYVIINHGSPIHIDENLQDAVE